MEAWEARNLCAEPRDLNLCGFRSRHRNARRPPWVVTHQTAVISGIVARVSAPNAIDRLAASSCRRAIARTNGDARSQQRSNRLFAKSRLCPGELGLLQRRNDGLELRPDRSAPPPRAP